MVPFSAISAVATFLLLLLCSFEDSTAWITQQHPAPQHRVVWYHKLSACSEDDDTNPYESQALSDKESRRRRRMLKSMFGTLLVLGSDTLASSSATARNLPLTTGGDTSNTGTIETLIPIVRLQQALKELQSQLPILNTPPQEKDKEKEGIALLLPSTSIVPRDEMSFKRLLDAYSDPVSYKQKFVDQNAFLVYYTQGFDGPGRPNIEDDLPVKQTLQYGARNDAWVAWDDFLVEWDFYLKNRQDNYDNEENNNQKDLLQALERTIKALDAYLSLAPPEDLQQARSKVMSMTGGGQEVAIATTRAPTL